VRQSETEALRKDVKQVILAPDAASLLNSDVKILDRREEGRELAIVVEGAEKAIERLEYEGVEHRVVDLNLDEIFEAYVTGNTQSREPQIAAG
jgi:hypothetical protein